MKKKLLTALVISGVVGMANTAEAALWNFNFGSKAYAGEGLAPQSTEDDYWVKLSNASMTGSYNSTDDTVEASLETLSTSITTPLGAAALQGYSTGLSKFNVDTTTETTITGNPATVYEVYLYTTNGTVTLSAGESSNRVSGAELMTTSFSDGTATSYTVNKYWVRTTDPGIIKLSTSSDATGRINAVQVRSIVPEPSTLMLLGVGGLVASFGVKRKYAVIES